MHAPTSPGSASSSFSMADSRDAGPYVLVNDCTYPRNKRVPFILGMAAYRDRQRSHCSRKLPRPTPGPDPSALQNTHPPTLSVPSRFGHPDPASSVIFCTFSPNSPRKCLSKLRYRKLRLISHPLPLYCRKTPPPATEKTEREERQKRHAGEIIPPAPPSFCFAAKAASAGQGERENYARSRGRTGRECRPEGTLSASCTPATSSSEHCCFKRMY